MGASFTYNEMLLRALDIFTEERVDFDAAERAFAGTRGDFRAKLTAALQAVTVAQLKPERFIEIPASPESLSKAQLAALVEPNFEYISSYANKAELVDALGRIKRRQESRPAWMPRTPDSAARPAEDEAAEKQGSWPAFTRGPLTLTGLPELGPVVAEVPSWYEDPVYAPDTLTATAVQLALLTALGIGPDPTVDQTVPVKDFLPSAFGFAPDDAEASTAALSAADGHAVVIELLATSATLGGVPVSDEADESAALDVLASAGDWWHSPAIVLDRYFPFGGEARRTVARCSAAGWASEDGAGAGFVILADAVAADSEGTVGAGGSDLHRFMLWWEREDDSEPEGGPAGWEGLALPAGCLHRIVLHCPGEGGCLRDECPAADAVEIDLLMARIIDQATAVAAMLTGGDWATGAYLGTLVDGDNLWADEEPGEIMWIAEQTLAGYGWQAASQGVWETGDVDRLLYRDGHVIHVQHHLAERALSVRDGLQELEALRDMSEEEALAVQPGQADDPEDAVLHECLQRLDLGTMTPVTGFELPRFLPLLALWPWGDGQPHSERAHETAKAGIEGWLRGLPGIA